MAYTGLDPQMLNEIFGKFLETASPDRPKLEMHTSYMEELLEPGKIAADLSALRKGELRRKGYNFSSPYAAPHRSGELYPRVDFDTLVGTGFSGTLPLLSIANELGVNWLAIRKEGEDTHTGAVVEGSLGKRWLFLDDFIETGKTYAYVRKLIADNSKASHFDTEHVGVFQYHAFRDEFMAPNHQTIVHKMRYFNVNGSEYRPSV